jgi:hypothetical protein
MNFRRGCQRALAIASLALGLCGCDFPRTEKEARNNWQRVEGPEGEVWRSDRGRWRAEIEPHRGRLSFLGLVSGPNLLNRPPGPPDVLQFGGHRIWLGPQTEWPVMWPPPSVWEMKPAARVQLRDDGILELQTGDGGEKAPLLTRTYHWKSEGWLVCGVSWLETRPEGRQSIQILQIDRQAEVVALPGSFAAAPRGYVRMPITKRKTTEREFPVPSHVRVEGDAVIMRLESEEEKLGFPVQPLLTRWKDVELRLHPGRWQGAEAGDPDEGFRAHVYLGSKDWPVLEIEQLSPRLRPSAPGTAVSHTVEIELSERLR